MQSFTSSMVSRERWKNECFISVTLECTELVSMISTPSTQYPSLSSKDPRDARPREGCGWPRSRLQHPLVEKVRLKISAPNKAQSPELT
jgi:hypothetical protein